MQDTLNEVNFLMEGETWEEKNKALSALITDALRSANDAMVQLGVEPEGEWAVGQFVAIRKAVQRYFIAKSTLEQAAGQGSHEAISATHRDMTTQRNLVDMLVPKFQMEIQQQLEKLQQSFGPR